MARAEGWNRRFGAAAEEHAARWLRARGLEVVARGYRCAEGELDIVARDGPVWVIVEVKARSSRHWGAAVEAVGPVKRRRIVAAARRFLWEHRALAQPIRFDVVALHTAGGRVELSWTRNAFTA